MYNVLLENANRAFGTNLVDNLTDNGKDMCHVGQARSINDIETTEVTGDLIEEPAIQTIADSRKNYSKRDRLKGDIVRRF